MEKPPAAEQLCLLCFSFFFIKKKIAILTPFKSSLVPFRAVVLNPFLV